tara:strand:- start:162 stop:443 length:282 start_codon:yes stop_codon:yes gene_type:complete
MNNLELCMEIFSVSPLQVKRLFTDELIIRLEDSEITLSKSDINCIAGIIENCDEEINLGTWPIDYTRMRIFTEGLSEEDKELYFSLSIFSTIH